MFYYIEAISNKNSISIFQNIGIIAFFLGDLNAYESSKYSKITNILSLFSSSFFWYKLSILTFG